MAFRGHGGVMHFGISEGMWGGGGGEWVKIWKLSVGGYGYFLESPILKLLMSVFHNCYNYE